jgi:hypothetical protein
MVLNLKKIEFVTSALGFSGYWYDMTSLPIHLLCRFGTFSRSNRINVDTCNFKSNVSSQVLVSEIIRGQYGFITLANCSFRNTTFSSYGVYHYYYAYGGTTDGAANITSCVFSNISSTGAYPACFRCVLSSVAIIVFPICIAWVLVAHLCTQLLIVHLITYQILGQHMVQ